MKKIFILTAIAALFLASSCNERFDFPSLTSENVIAFDLVYGDPVTKSNGVGAENTVNSVQYFLYNDVESDPIFDSGLITNPTITNLKYSVTLVAGEAGVPPLSTLFQDGECIVYAVFNSPAITAAPLADVKQTALANTFAHEGAEAGSSTGSKWVVNLDNASDYPKYFVMAGELALTRAAISSDYAATGEVEMNRVAAKISIDLKIKQEVTDKNGKVWVPMLGGTQIRVYPQNMAGSAVLGGADPKTETSGPIFPTDLNLFTYKEIALQSEKESSYVVDDGTYYVIASQEDFYTYPMEWEPGSDDEPFIKVIVPWRGQSGTTSQKEIYYKVMLPLESIESNKYYNFTVVASVLGTEGEPEVTLEPLSAMVVDWQGGDPVNGTISAAKYLSVERGLVTATSDYDTAEGRFEFYTATSGTIFAASDPVTVTIKEIKQKNLKTGQWEYLYNNFAANTSEITKRGYPTDSGVHHYSQEEVESDWVQKVGEGENYLQIGHQLNSDLTSPLMDVTPYYYTVVLSLPEEIDPDGEYSKTVTFVQWPEVYVVEDPNKSTNNDGYVFLNTYNRSSSFTSRYNNRNYTTTLDTQNNSYDYLGGIHGLTGTNANPSMYVLTISVSGTYTIGDPRSTSVSNPSFTYNGFHADTGLFDSNDTHAFNGTWNSAPFTEGGNHALTYYHPAANTSNSEGMIAPKIRIASSYGVTLPISETKAIARCAAYQEDGIPAGRWRLPTLAEVQFISQLSALERIPLLFGSATGDSYYWTANGQIVVNNEAGTAGKPQTAQNTAYIRCVYDEWFWGDATTSRPVNAATFTWGDRNY